MEGVDATTIALPDGWTLEPNTDLVNRPMVRHWLCGPRGCYRLYDHWDDEIGDVIRSIVHHDEAQRARWRLYPPQTHQPNNQ
jgi:hypothetical protein